MRRWCGSCWLATQRISFSYVRCILSVLLALTYVVQVVLAIQLLLNELVPWASTLADLDQLIGLVHVGLHQVIAPRVVIF